jgi:hypothetical protein
MAADYLAASAAIAFFIWMLVMPHYCHKASVQLRNEMTKQDADVEAL